MAVSERRTPPPSPCNFTCIVDRKKGWCVGCLRTLDEIGRWEQMSPEQQWAVVDQLSLRRTSVDTHGS